jgi:F0F1-type ATP synthase epsilon subunit
MYASTRLTRRYPALSNIPAVSGDMGILANHVPTVEALRPGLVEVIESAGTTKKFFGTYRGL